LALIVLLGCADSRAVCTIAGACLSARPRLISVDTAQTALLNPLLGGILGAKLTLTAVN